MENASTYVNDQAMQLINGAGAYLLCAVSFSPNLNPIDLAFTNYKSILKMKYELGEVDWYQAYLNVIDFMSGDICVKEYMRCGVFLRNDLL